MRRDTKQAFTVAALAFACLLATAPARTALAQYGLYGSPEVLRLPEQESAQQYSTPTSYPATATPAAAYYPAQPQYAYPAQPQYAYPAQPQATTSYQPYQPGSQYRYPSPSLRAPVRTASVGKQPARPTIPTPPAEPVMPMPSDAQTIAPPPAGPGMMDQMLAEQGRGCNGCGGVYRSATDAFEQAACGPGAGCGDALCGDFFSPWYASISALVLSRSNPRRLWTTYNTDVLPDQLMNSEFSMAWKWGGEARVGRRFCCCGTTYALEGTYWTTESFTGMRSASVAGGSVSTTLDERWISFGGTGADMWFEGAREQTLSRRDEFHNFEINLIRQQLAWACDSPWDIGWSVGIRYFRFQDDLRFSSLRAGYDWDEPYGVATFGDNITNNLIGAQFGFDAAYNVWNGLRLFISPKVGLYDNYIDSNFRAELGDGTIGRSDYYGSFANAHGTKNVVAILTQIDVGVDWQFTRNWSARAGYRLVAVTNMGLADDQFPQYLTDIPEIQAVQSNGSLLLHGAFFGVTYNF